MATIEERQRIYSKPYIRIRELAKLLDVSEATARRMYKKALDSGEKIYQLPAGIALDDCIRVFRLEKNRKEILAWRNDI